MREIERKVDVDLSDDGRGGLVLTLTDCQMNQVSFRDLIMWNWN